MAYSLDFDYSKIFTKDILETRSNIDEFLHIVTEVDENPKSIHAFLPKLCSAVFGSREKRGWLHRRLTRQEEKAIYDLLKPSSHLFKAIVRFHTERNLLYEILPDHLPKSIQNSLTPNSYETLPNYYRGKVQFTESDSNQTTSSLSASVKNDKVKLMFNMLEYYLFCFCYVMTVDFPSQSTSQWSKSMMPEVNDSYLHNNVGNFPQSTDPSAQYSQYQHNMQAQNVYIELLHGYMEYLIPYGPQVEKIQRDGSKLQRPSYNIFTDSNANSSGMKNLESSLALSEFFVGTVSELWFKYTERFEGTRGRRASFSSINQRPSVDLLQCISDFINHLIGADLRFSYTPSEGKLWDTDDSEFYLLVKKNAYHTLHPHLYQFLKSSMSWWLLDDTFTNIVDIWLNYISPWGYSGTADKDKVLSKDWIPFILDNFLFYTEIFRRFLERAADLEIAEPVDLDGDRKYYGTHPSQGVIAKLSPKSNVRMIRRVLKLFRTIGLHEYLRGIELFIMSPDYASFPNNVYRQQNLQFHQTNSLVQFGLDSKLLSTYGATVRQHINNLESQQFEYKPIFHDSTKDTIKILIAKITVALEKRNKILDPDVQLTHPEPQSLYRIIFDFTKKAVQGSEEEAWKGSLVRQRARLETILRLIGELFDITDKDWQDLNLSPSLANLQITPGVQTPEFFSEDPTHLTQRGRTQVKLGLRKCSKYDVPIIGNRGNLIVRSYENATLVDFTRWLDTQVEYYYNQLVRYLIEEKRIQVPRSLRAFPFSFRFFAAYPNLLFLFIIWLFYRLFCLIFF